MKKFPIAWLCGIASVIVTGILYVILFREADLKAIHFITFGAIVLSELITTIYAAASKGRPRRVAAAVMSALAIPVTITLSYVYLNFFPDAYITFICWSAATLVLVNTFSVILVGLDSNKGKQNDQLQAAKQNMLQMRQQVQCIAAIKGAQPYAARLKALDESLRFSNDAVIAMEDGRIQQLLTELQAGIYNEGFDAENMLSQLEQLVQRRTVQNRYSK